MLRISQPDKHVRQGVKLQGQVASVLSGSFVYLVLGRPGSGKSHLVQQLIADPRFYSQKFDRILYCGPTRYEHIQHTSQNTCTGLDLGFLTMRLKDFMDQHQPVHVLIVLDDLASQIAQFKNNESFRSLFFNRRHLMKPGGSVSVIITSQRYSLTPQFIRSCVTGIFIFKLTTTDTKTMITQCAIKKSKNLVLGILQNLGQHEFLFLSTTSGRLYNDSFVEL